VIGPLQDRRVLLGVTGSIACYKAVDLASKLTQAGALVDVLMTASALEFVTPLTFRSVTHRPVVTNIFDPESREAVEHVALAQEAEVLVVAPATAHTLAKLAWGMADDPVSITALATSAPVVLAPAMDAGMWEHPAVQANLETLKQRGAVIVGPASGHLASGIKGKGRLVEPQELLGHIAQVLGRHGDLAGRIVVVSAGGTQEPLDPVRTLTNRSSGKMGYAVAEAARDRGAEVVLVAGPTALPDPVGVRVVRAPTSEEMSEAVLEACRGADVLVMAAAVADYRPVEVSSDKVKRGSGRWSLELDSTPDILAQAPARVVRVGFAAESANLIQNAQVKLHQKGIDLMVANDITSPGSGFGTDTNQVVILNPLGNAEEIPLLPKYEVALRILDRVATILQSRDQPVRS
jgi:phosphopantothenoylcysteine decarboxylase/phosphopantothenate--cysteine ligase